MSTVIYEHELAIIAPNDIHMLKMNEKESIIADFHRFFACLIIEERLSFNIE